MEDQPDTVSTAKGWACMAAAVQANRGGWTGCVCFAAHSQVGRCFQNSHLGILWTAAKVPLETK